MVLVDLRRVVWQREPHAVGHPAVGEELNGLLCASGPSGACSLVCVSPCGRTDTDDCY